MNKRSIALLTLVGAAYAVPGFAQGLSRADVQADLARAEAAGLPGNEYATYPVATQRAVAAAAARSTQQGVAQTAGNAPKTRAEVRAELVAAEAAGWVPADDYNTYPSQGAYQRRAVVNPVAQGERANGMSYSLQGETARDTY
ncbi:DUF4148 domain-containing protein [Chitinasiproducens palmae]|uniref:DUF4148 domain-containing protein n=1 Tax=Chitinasiproducens palmae TaxID=1770053 RepID=A0A1H2PNV9_9BURK|nr:DUF4148 domain-containing protein [Chitinasiproducens palmae]SDV48398.1 protein of unknown function [Chitinasiproducens palmae]